MPLLALRCVNDHTAEQYIHAPDDRGAETRVCACGESLAPVLSVGTGLTWFEEGRGRWISNLGVEPVYITSHAQHVREMKRAGVEWATERQTQGRGGWV